MKFRNKIDRNRRCPVYPPHHTLGLIKRNVHRSPFLIVASTRGENGKLGEWHSPGSL